MNDFREYVGIDYTPYLMHYGVPHGEGPGRGSGRYAWGSGDRPKQSLEGKKAKDYRRRLKALEKNRAKESSKVTKLSNRMQDYDSKLNARSQELRAKAQRKGKILDHNLALKDRKYRKLYKKEVKTITKFNNSYDKQKHEAYEKEIDSLIKEIEENGGVVSKEKVRNAESKVRSFLSRNSDRTKYTIKNKEAVKIENAVDHMLSDKKDRSAKELKKFRNELEELLEKRSDANQTLYDFKYYEGREDRNEHLDSVLKEYKDTTKKLMDMTGIKDEKQFEQLDMNDVTKELNRRIRSMPK